DADAQYLAALGENVTDIGQLFAFEEAQANGLNLLPRLASAEDMQVPAPGLPLSVSRTFTNSIIGRYHEGPFGRGWSWDEGWDRTLTVLPDGTVSITDGEGAERRFQPDRRGGFFAQPGDHASLTSQGAGVYTLQDLDGLLTAFNADGTVHYLQDTNGNRITAGYTNGLLSSLTHSSGQQLLIHYNTAGRIDSITDPASGRSATYT